MSRQIGQRVGAICGTVKETNTVEIFGYGVYEGDHVAGEGDPKPVGFIADLMKHGGRPNPRIRLDNGKVVWGCECWWGAEDEVKRRLEHLEAQGYSVVEVDIEVMRAKVKEQASQRA